ncbi:hypothetical protein NKH18_18655 [Streptomyces sp. M10(2022)]
MRDVRSGHPNDTSAKESAESLADQDSGTKWYARDSGRPTVDRPVHAIYRLRAPAAVTGYSLTSANDAAPRDPAAWTVLGSDSDSAAKDADDSSWKVLDEEKGSASVPAGRATSTRSTPRTRTATTSSASPTTVLAGARVRPVTATSSSSPTGPCAVPRAPRPRRSE